MNNMLGYDKDSIICACNNVTLEEISDYIKKNNIKTMGELLDNEVVPVGNKCESCVEKGCIDGLNLEKILNMNKMD